MPKQQFTFKTFSNGLSNDPTKWKTHGYYAAGFDLIGIGDITGTPLGGRPNALQLGLTLTLDSVSASTAPATDPHLTGIVQWIRQWSGVSAGDYWALEPVTSAGNPGKVLRRTSTAGKWVSGQRISAATGGGGLEKISAYMYYGQNAVLGQITSAGVYANNFASFTLGGATPRPMKIFAGKLCVGNDNYISTVDSTQTFTAAALTLPTGFVVRSLEVLGNYLVISADNGVFSRIFLWTGGTATYQEAYDLPESSSPVLVSREGRVFAISKAIYVLGETSYSTLYPFNYYGDSPGVGGLLSIISAGSVALYDNKILYGISEETAALTNRDQAGGIYLMGQYDNNSPFITSLTFLLPNQITSAATYAPNTIDVGGLYANNQGQIFAGFRDTAGSSTTSAQYGIATGLAYAHGASSSTYYVTLPLDMDTDNNKLFHSIRMNMQGLTSNSTLAIAVSYRINSDFGAMGSTGNLGSWTLAKTIKPSDGGSQLLNIPLRQKGRNIMFKFLFTGGTATPESPQLLDYTVLYETLDTYR